MESSAVALMSVLEGCDQAKLLSLSLGKGSHAGTPKLLGIITRWELVRNESRQSPPLLPIPCSCALQSREGRDLQGSSGQS